MEPIHEVDDVAFRYGEDATCPSPSSSSISAGESRMGDGPASRPKPSATENGASMQYDAAAPQEAFPLAKESAKKKRASKSAAKLKQSKLDIRREQFLAKVAVNAANAAKSGPLANGNGEAQPSPVTTHLGAADSQPGALQAHPGPAQAQLGLAVASNGDVGKAKPPSETSTGGSKAPGEVGLGEGKSWDATGASSSSSSSAKSPEAASQGSSQENGEIPSPDDVVSSNPGGESIARENGPSRLVAAEEDGEEYECLVRRVVSLNTAWPVPEGAPVDFLAGVRGSREASEQDKGSPSTSDAYAESAPAVRPCETSRAQGKAKNGGGWGAVSMGSEEAEGVAQVGQGKVAKESVVEDGLEEDWEAAAEQFSKKVVKHASKKANDVATTASDATPADSAQLPPKGASGAGLAAAPPVEYSFRPNQQPANGIPLPSQRLAPNGLRPDYGYTGTAFSRSRSMNNDRAWRPDDTSRPPTLPPALSHRNVFSGMDLSLGAKWRNPNGGPQLNQLSQWPTPQPQSQLGQQQLPPCCPICAEELDVTDSSFVPCSCGFRLCLFCHHRIAAEDGRCPGCRKEYSADAASRLSKAPSMWLRL